MSTVSPVTENELTETEYLLSSPANAAHLARSIEQYRGGDVHGQSQGQIQSQVPKRDLVDAG
jgi:PHD/YefM family antitoxin component YafN of YafNO toxin-antitoxin module